MNSTRCLPPLLLCLDIVLTNYRQSEGSRYARREKLRIEASEAAVKLLLPGGAHD